MRERERELSTREKPPENTIEISVYLGSQIPSAILEGSWFSLLILCCSAAQFYCDLIQFFFLILGHEFKHILGRLLRKKERVKELKRVVKPEIEGKQYLSLLCSLTLVVVLNLLSVIRSEPAVLH